MSGLDLQNAYSGQKGATPPAIAQSCADALQAILPDTGTLRGTPSPLGVCEFEGGVNFAVFSRHATRVELEFYRRVDDLGPDRVLELDPVCNRTGDIWHVWVGGVPEGQLYAYRVDGPFEPGKGQRFDCKQLLLDPCATAIKRASSPGIAPKCVFMHADFDWLDDQPPRHPWSKTVIYETHVRGLTVHPSAASRFPGTYRGLIEKIPHLKSLGVTAVELLPVQEFDSRATLKRDPVTGAALHNYWGYAPVTFFAPNGAYSSAGDAGQQVAEFKEMVRRLHAAGIEVILDVVLDHTAEADEYGQTLCWRGLDNPIYYSLQPDKRHYRDASGTGNTINANHPVVRHLIIGALRHWVVDMHVDGFRFDLASILGRDSEGKLLTNAPVLEQIAEDPILRETKLIAEAWDAAGAYKVGSFGERRWAEWNGRYRDDVRRFWRGDPGMLAAFASRICGSEDLYGRSGKGPECSINFVTCHDGFTLNDLVSYREKHNAPNGEGDSDGADTNYSANYGVEGPSTDVRIGRLRERQIKNFLLTLFISRGVPMLLGGDEFRRTQLGNNNAYCQDNETSWYDWRELQRHPDVYNFVRRMTALRRAHPALAREHFYTTAEIRWFTPEGVIPDWNDPQARSVGCLVQEGAGEAMYLMFNAEERPMTFVIPPASQGRQWRLAVDTANEIVTGCAVSQVRVLEPRSSAVLVTLHQGGCDPLLDDQGPRGS
jgi:isoamylase